MCVFYVYILQGGKSFADELAAKINVAAGAPKPDKTGTSNSSIAIPYSFFM